jgi:hypothetical protein
MVVHTMRLQEYSNQGAAQSPETDSLLKQCDRARFSWQYHYDHAGRSATYPDRTRRISERV